MDVVGPPNVNFHGLRNPEMRFHRLTVAALSTLFCVGSLPADESPGIGTAEFQKLHRLIKPQAGESRWMEIDWFPNVWEARRKAAAEGKPILLWAGSGGAPAAGC
jgi:hypothetical protein